MREWTDSETDTLVSLWPSHSTSQIAAYLHRPRSAVSAKAHRLRQEGLLPAEVEKHFDVRPWKARAKPDLGSAVKPERAYGAPAHHIDEASAIAMQPCTLIELEAGRCRWPLGDVEAVATMFCGGAVETSRRYCLHHLRRAARS
jgi:hypothetical protein